MSKKIQNTLDTSFNDKSNVLQSKDSLSTTKIPVHDEKKPNTNNTYNCDFKKYIEELEREADINVKEIELNEYVEFVSQLVDLLKHTVIIPELKSEDDWHDDIGHQIKRNKGTTGDTLLDDKIEKIAIKKGLSKEQWKRLLYVNFTADDSLEMINITKSHLKKVYDMTSRLVDGDEQTAVFALIDAIERHIPKNHFSEK